MQDESGVSGHMDLLLYTRNRSWVQQMEPIMQEKSTLFAVGAGHLGGENGVLDLLRKKGYNLRPIVN